MVVNGEVVMRKSWIVAGALAGATLFAAPALAQRAADGAGFEVTPYVGYLFGEDIVSGPFGTSLGAGNGAIYGGQLSIPLMPGISLVGNVGYSSGQLRAGIPILGGFRFGESSTWVYDGSLELAVPVGAGVSSVQPFLQIGVGGIRRELSIGGVATTATSVAYHAGLGLDFGLLPNLGLRLLARDYVGKFDFKEAAFLDYDGELMHNVALSVGLRLAL